MSRSDAIFATDLLVATPTEIVSDNSDRTRSRNPAAMDSGERPASTAPVTSRYASSSDIASTRSVTSWKMSMTRRDTSR